MTTNYKTPVQLGHYHLWKTKNHKPDSTTDYAKVIAKNLPFEASALRGYPNPGIPAMLMYSPHPVYGQLPRDHKDYAKWTEDLTHADYVIFSYYTPIAWRNEGTWTAPDVKYSRTTTGHQSIVKGALSLLENLPEPNRDWNLQWDLNRLLEHLKESNCTGATPMVGYKDVPPVFCSGYTTLPPENMVTCSTHWAAYDLAETMRKRGLTVTVEPYPVVPDTIEDLEEVNDDGDALSG